MRVSISLLSFAAAESPCPSERCWSFDEASGNCELLPGCAEVSCDANALRIEFVPEYFGVENNGEAEFADCYFDDGKYFTNCNLGECGMRADYNEDGDIVFSVEIQDEQKSIKIGDLELFKKSQPTTLTASCVYASTVSVSSNAFNLTFADASHDLVGVGDFGSQFSMSISDKDGETGGDIMIGEPVTVDIEWQKELNYLGFFPTDCYVALGGDDEQQAEIIKGGCFSSTLGVTKTGPYGEKLHESRAGFTYKSFSGSSELTSQNVKITCDLKICFFGDEACYETPSCPTEPAGYEYTEFGCSEEEQRPDKNGFCFEDTCNGGETGKCTAWGDPHYKTFDGEQHHYMGTCWHTFAKSTAEGSVGRPAFQFEAKTDDFGSDVVSYVSGIRLFVNGEGDPVRSSDEFRYKIEASREALSSNETPPRPGVKFTGTQMSGLKIFDQDTGQVYEKFFDGDGLQVTFSNDGIAITTWFGLKINYQHHNWGLELILPDCYRKAVNGLCGNWDGVKFDQGLPEIDYKDIESHPENVKHMVLEWSNWADNFVVADDECVAGPPGGETNLSHLRGARKRRAIEEADIARAVGLCEKLKSTSPLFQGCPADKPSQFAECIFDVAVDENNYCESAAKARDCIRSRNDPYAAVCHWANSLGCPQTCPENSEFKGCANVCESEKTCQNRWQRNRCNGKIQLDSRCTCKPGFMFEGSRCVPESNCGCNYGNSYYPIGAKWHVHANYICECIGGTNGGYQRCKSDSCYNKDNCVNFSSYPNPLWTRRNNQIGEIPVSINFELGINVNVYGPHIKETPEWKNVVHITNNGNYGSHGERIFGIWQNHQNQRNLLTTVGSPFSSHTYQNVFFDEPCPIDKYCQRNYVLKRFQNPSNPELVTTQLFFFTGNVFTGIAKGLNVLDNYDYELVMEFDALKQDVLQSGTAKVFASDPWHTTASSIPVSQLYYQTFPTIGRSCSDIIDPCSGKKDCQTFVNSCAINPTRSNEVGIVEKPYVHFKISADVQCTNLHEINQWFSIFHVTTGEDSGSFGSRIFAIWKSIGRASSFHVPVNHHSEGQRYYQRVFYPECENGEWDTHEMEQRQSDTDQAVTVTEYRQIRNGVVVFSGSYEQQTSDLLLYKKFHVYVGDPWYAPGSGFMVRNFFYQKLDGVRFTENLGSVKTAFEGELRCRKQGGHLAFFRNAEDHERYVSATQFATISFVGAQRIGATDEFVNVDGSTPYLPWRAGEPNHLLDENCVNAYPSDHAVNDLQCNIPAQYSCRIDAQPECVDIEPHCNPAKCDNGFNKKFCLKTCGICESWTPEAVGDITYLEELGPDNCEDTNDKCAFWAADNQCMVNPVYMLRHCPASCKQCTPNTCTNTFAGITPRVIFVKMDSPASTFAEAEETCAKNLGQLAFFKNEAEYNEYLREPITEKEWLGTRRFGDGWLNSDGSAPFLKWNVGEPNNSGGENCLEIYVTSQDQSSQLMNDQSCGDRNKFRCRIETYLDNDDKLRVCLNDPSADQCQASEIGESCIKAEDGYKVSLEVRCNGVDDEHRGVAALSRGSNDYYFGVGSVKGWPQNLFFWMENPNGLNAVGAEILTHDGTQWWQNSINPTYVFPCTPGEWNRVVLTQYLDSHTNKWIKTLTINGEDRYRITSDAPNEGSLTAFDNIPQRAFSKNQMRNFKIEPY